MSPRAGLLIGSISPDIATTPKGAMSYYVKNLTHRKTGAVALPALATGETSDSMWSAQQLAAVGRTSAVRELWRGNFTRTERYSGAPVMIRKRGRHISADELDLKFLSRAKKDYSVFEEVKQDLQLSDDTRMQVGINTLDILMLGLRFGARTEVDAFIERTRREVAEIWNLTKGKVFFLIEMPTATITANLLRNNRTIQNWLVQAYVRLIKALPRESSWGLHFCHGRVGNSALFDNGAIMEKLRLRNLVYAPERTVNFSNQLINALSEQKLIPELVHYTMSFGKRPPTMDLNYYRAYRDIELPDEVAVFPGAIHYLRSNTEAVKLYEHFDELFGRQTGVATYCGFGSLSGEQMNKDLEQMSFVANA